MTDAATYSPMGDEHGMRVALRVHEVTPERLRYIKQIGVDDVLITPGTEKNNDDVLTVQGDYAPSVDELLEMKHRIEDANLRLLGINSLDRVGRHDKILLGRPGADEQLEMMKTLIKNMGEADYPVLGLLWNVVDVPDSLDFAADHMGQDDIFIENASFKAILRGGAIGAGVDLTAVDDYTEPIDFVGREYSESELLDNYEHFLNEVIPIAEDAGVYLGVHPDDPPVVEQLGGTYRLFRDFESHKKALNLYPSDHHGLRLGLGVFSEMPDEDVYEVVQYFAEHEKILFLHFRDVRGNFPTFHETFHDDPESNFDQQKMIQLLNEVGYSGVIVPNHYPVLEGDTAFQHRSKAYACGYLNGLISTIQ